MPSLRISSATGATATRSRNAHKLLSDNQRAHALAQMVRAAHGKLRAIAERGEALSTETEDALIGFYG